MSPADPAQGQRVEVLKAGRPAATLTADGAQTTFAYRHDYTGPPVAHRLPLGVEVHRSGRATPAFFANLLPEGRRLSALRRAVKTSADDDLTLLLAVSDTIGDVSLQGEAVVGRPAPLVDEPLIGTSQQSRVSFQEVLQEHGFVDRIGLPGAQDKLSAGMITMPVRWGNTAAIIKLNPPDYPFAVENEHYFLGLARRIGVPVANTMLIHDRDGRPGLLVARFDRPATGPLAVEDGCQLLDRYPSDKYLVTFEDLANAVAEVCAARPVALRALLLQVYFAWLTGNGDLHAKNISVLQLPSGEWRVAPIYDIPSTLPYGDHTMALSMGGRVEGFGRSHLIAVGTTLGLPKAAAERALADALRATAPLLDDLQAGALPFNATLSRTLRRQLGRRRRDAEA